jgi:transposase-like protein
MRQQQEHLHLHHLQQQWFQQEEVTVTLVMYALSFLDVKTLLQTETVNKTWRKLCKKTLRNKCCGRPKVFQHKQELKDAITKYCCYEGTTMEEIAGTYGYPMDTWNVSQITNMSFLFQHSVHSMNTLGKGMCQK